MRNHFHILYFDSFKKERNTFIRWYCNAQHAKLTLWRWVRGNKSAVPIPIAMRVLCLINKLSCKKVCRNWRINKVQSTARCSLRWRLNSTLTLRMVCVNLVYTYHYLHYKSRLALKYQNRNKKSHREKPETIDNAGDWSE